jgi:hypothetical protein
MRFEGLHSKVSCLALASTSSACRVVILLTRCCELRYLRMNPAVLSEDRILQQLKVQHVHYFPHAIELPIFCSVLFRLITLFCSKNPQLSRYLPFCPQSGCAATICCLWCVCSRGTVANTSRRLTPNSGVMVLPYRFAQVQACSLRGIEGTGSQQLHVRRGARP